MSATATSRQEGRGAGSAASGLDRLAAATPSTRDRYVDFLRAFSIAVVVFGHWLVAIVYLNGSELSGASALDAVPAARLLTWVLQVMPLFFFVGGFSNLTSWRAVARKGGDYGSFVGGRVDRLMRPCAAFIGLWVAVAVVLHFAAPSLARDLEPALAIIAKPLWFISVYLIVIALAPAMLRLHERFRIGVPLAMAGAAAAVDVGRLAFDVPVIGYLNFAFVWLFAHQLGFFYADGSFGRLPKRALAGCAVAAVVALVALTQLGPYSTSMVGVDDGRVSNNDPPSICIVAHSIWLISAAMLARGPVTRWLQGGRAWKAVIAANSMIMTVFLWHLTALLAGVLLLYPIGFPQSEGGSAEWWLLRPVWLAILVVLLAPFVAVFGRFERPRSTPRRETATAGRRLPALLRAVAGIGRHDRGDGRLRHGGVQQPRGLRGCPHQRRLRRDRRPAPGRDPQEIGRRRPRGLARFAAKAWVWAGGSWLGVWRCVCSPRCLPPQALRPRPVPEPPTVRPTSRS